jgi:hypothetical protein
MLKPFLKRGFLYFISLLARPIMKKFITAFILFAFAKALTAQTLVNPTLDYYLPAGTTYDASIPKPQDILGYVPGTWHVTHDKLDSYMRALATSSDRITLTERGKTFEGRPLLLLTITSPKNQRNLEQLRADHVALTTNDNGDTSSMPVVIYQGFSIHGNEPSGSNAALILAYHLAAAQGAAIDDLLENAIILFDPSLNPDGLQRFAGWVNQHKSKNINPDNYDREYDEVWPGGRTNHYWFDMNRDWLPAQLPESQARISTFHDWYPNILTDHHEMGTNSTFFFQPGVPSRTHPLTPALNQQLTAKIGTYHAAALDKIGSFYYTEENFDDFYYGKGSTFPDINGGVGILFEQASSRGHAQESENGLLTFPFTIRNQFTAGLSTLQAAIAMRKELLDYQHSFYESARKESAKESGAIIFGDHKDAAKTNAMAQVLARHKIEFYDLKENVTFKDKTFKKGYSYLIPKNQKNSRLVRAMFEKRTRFQDSLFYDISAWSFPLAFNVDYDENVPLSSKGTLQAMDNGKIKGTNEGPNTVDPYKIINASSYAYLLPWNEYYAPKAVYRLLAKGVRVKMAMQQFKMNGVNYDYGTILIPLQNQDFSVKEIQELLGRLQIENELKFTAVQTGQTLGIDLGSNQFRALTAPKIALLVGEGLDYADAGEIWHLLDQRMDMLVTKLDINALAGKDLSKYTTIIAPPTYGSPEKTTLEKLKDWTRDGGTLIGYGSALRWMSSESLLPLTFKTTENPAKNITFEQRADFNGAQAIGGAIFETKLDRSHPIAFGFKDDLLPIFKNTKLFVEPHKDSYRNPIKYNAEPLMSGYISKLNLEALKGSVPFQHNNYGRGDVVGFTENTQFRAFWYGTNKLLFNAIFFAKEM